MADTNANIRIDVDASAALAQIKQLQRQISLFHSTMSKGGAAAAAQAQNLQRNLVNGINATGQFSANMTRISSTTESFTNALEKNKLSMGQYFRFAGASTKSFGRLFKSEFNTINKVARERVKGLQTQYIKMGRDANGAMQAIRVRPLTLDLQSLGTQTAIAAQKQALLNQLVRQGSINLLNWGKNTQWAGRQLMVGFTIPLTIMGAMAGREFMKLEEQAIRFKRVYGDMFTSEAETEKAIEDIKQLATEFTKYGIAVEKTVELAATVAQLGSTGTDLTNQVTQATRLAVLGGIEQEEALDTTISLTNAFGLSTEELSDKIAFLNAVENQTILSIEDFNVAIPKAGAVIQQLGGDVEDLAFFLTAMREGGINASESANALKSGLASIINPTQQSIDKMKEFGIDVVGIVDQNAGNLRETVMSLAGALNNLDALDRARAIEQLFGKFQFARISTLFQNITKEGSQASKTLEIASSNARELGVIAERELGRVEASSMFQFKKALEEFQVALAPLGEAFLKLATPILEFGTKILDRFNGMSDGAKQFVVGLVAVMGVVAPAVLMVIGLLANGIANLLLFGTKISGAFSKVGGASNVLTEQINYMNSEQIESSAIAASLDQVHQTLIQTFNAEAGAVANLTGAYGRAITAQQAFLSAQGSPAASATAKAAGGAAIRAPKPSTNPFMPPKYADGIFSVPGTGNKDTELSLLTPGEAVIPAEMAKRYAPIIEGMISGNIPGYNGGKPGADTSSTQRGHMAPKLDTADPAIFEKLVNQGFSEKDIVDPNIMFLPDLTIDMPSWINQALKEGGQGVDPAIWTEAMSLDAIPGAFRKTLEAAMGQIGPDVDKLADGIQQRVVDRAAAMATAAGTTVTDEIVAAAAKEEIDILRKSEDPTERKAGEGLEERRTSAGKTRSKFENAPEELQARIDAGDAELTSSGKEVVTKDGVKIGRVSSNGRLKATEATVTKDRGGLPKSYGGRKKVGLSEEQAQRQAELAEKNKQILSEQPSEALPGPDGMQDMEAYIEGAESAVTPEDDPYPRSRDRSSPHRLSGQDGSDDGKEYREKFDVAAGGQSGSLAPPPPPPLGGSAGNQKRGRFSNFKDKAKSIGNEALDRFMETGPGQSVGNYFAETSGGDIVNSKGKVVSSAPEQQQTQRAPRQVPPGESIAEIQARNQALVDNRLATFDQQTGTMFATTTGKMEGLKDSFSVLDVDIMELGNTSQEASTNVDQHTQSVRENGDAATQSSAEMNATGGGSGGGRKGKTGGGDAPKPKRKGITGGGAGLSMGLSALTMGASMAPGALGEQAQKFMPALMALSAAPMLFQALQSPLVALLAIVVAIAAGIFILNSRMKAAQEEALELGRAMSSGADAMKELAEFAGTVSSGEFMDKARQERLTGVQTAPGKTTFGESFVEDEKGKALIEAAKTQMAQTGSAAATINSLTSKLATAVMSGVLTKEQASSMAANLGFALNNMEIGLKVRANIAALVGPNGEDITAGDLVEFSASMNIENLDAVEKQQELMNKELDGVFGDSGGERWAGNIGAGLGGAVLGAMAVSTAGLALVGTKMGATVGAAMAGPIGLAIGAAVGAGLGVGAAVLLMNKAAKEAGKLSGALVATMTNALQQQQEMSDAVDAYYIKKIEEAKIQGDITEQLRLQSEFEEKKVAMSEQEMALREKMKGVISGPGAEAARAGVSAAIETRFQDDADAKLVMPGIEALLKTFEEADKDMINLELATGAISPQALNSLLTFIGEDGAQKDALLNIFGTFGGVFADEAGQILSLVDDESLAADIFVKISSAGNEQEAQEILDFVREIQKQDAVFDTDVILRYVSENEEVSEKLEEIFNRADMGVITTNQAYEINPKLQNAEAFDELYFDMLPETDKEQYVKTVSMILEMDQAELIASDDFKKWTGDEGQVNGPFPGRHSLAKWQRLYAESMGDKVTSQLSSVDATFEDVEVEEEASGSGGGGPKASDLDDLLRRLKEIRQSTIEMTQGWVESRNALDRLFNDGGEIKIFEGIEQQMRRLGAGEDLISMIIGMDPEDYERRKNELFQFDGTGNIIGATTALQNMGKAFRSIALGDFQSEQQRVLGGINEQLVAFRKLTAAGLSSAMAYEAVKDAAFAAAVAREQDNNVIRQTIKLTKQATELSRAFASAQSLATKNAEGGDLRGVVKFIEQNAQSLSEAQKSAILSDKDLQTLIMNPSVDPKTLRETLKNASNEQNLELRIKRLTFDGLVEIFQDGFSKAMEAFSAQEQEITLGFDLDKQPFLDAIQEGEELISDIRNRVGGVDDLEADLERISRQEDEINKTYDKRTEALDEVEKANEKINKNKKAQLDVADALSQGDIAAAARAVREASQAAAEASMKERRDNLDLAREQGISNLVGNMGLTREQLEQKIKDLQIEVFNIEEQRLEPAQRQIELLDREQAVLIENLTVLGRTRTEWETIKNEIDLANVNSDRFQQAMQDALDVVENITAYWNNFEDKEVDLFVNVKQQGSVEDIEDAIQGPQPTPDPSGGGSSDADRQAILDAYKGKTIGSAIGDAPSGELAAIQEGAVLSPNIGTMQVEGAMVAAQRREQDAQAALTELEKKVADGATVREGDRPENYQPQRNQTTVFEGEIAAAKSLIEQTRINSEAAEARYNDMLRIRTEGDPMAAYNTGAMNMMDAYAFAMENIERNSEGVISGNIAGLFSDLGVNVPTFLKTIPGFFEHLQTNLPGLFEQMTSTASGFFNTLAANVDVNIGTIGQVFSKMAPAAVTALETQISPILKSYGAEKFPEDMADIPEWWAGLSDTVKGQVEGPIQDVILGLGENAVTDFEGTMGQYWEIMPSSIKEIFEGEITPFIEEQAGIQGMSVDEFLLERFRAIPSETAAEWDAGFAKVWNDMAVGAVQGMAGVSTFLANLDDNIENEKLRTMIGDALRGAFLEGEESYNTMLATIAAMGDGDIEEAYGEGGKFTETVNAGAEAGAESMDILAETIGEIPEDQRVRDAVLKDLPEDFATSGETSGTRFGNSLINKINAKIRDFKPKITVSVEVASNSGGPVLYGQSIGTPFNSGGAIPKFANGGRLTMNRKVPGTANYDKVRTLLTPGEFVMRQDAVKKYGEGFMQMINSAKLSPTEFSAPRYEASISGSSSPKISDSKNNSVMYNNYSVSINVKSESNPDQIAKTVIDQIKRVDSQRIRGNRF